MIFRPERKITSLLQKFGLLLLLVAFILLGLLYDFSVPLFEKPDELKHFAVIQHLQTAHELPTVIPGVERAWDQEGTQPPLYHLLAALAVSWLDLSDFQEPPRNPHYADERSFEWRERGNNNLYLHAPGEGWETGPVFVAARLARWLSLLAGLATILFTFQLAGIIFRGGATPLLAAGMVAFIPQFLHVSTAISNDALSTALAGATLVIFARIIVQGASRRRAVSLGIVLGLGAITKLSLLYLCPMAGLVLLLDFRRRGKLNLLLLDGAIVGGLILLLAGWWYGRNWQLYGDVFALNAHLLYRGGPLIPQPSLGEIWQSETTGLELSFWAAFGAGQILLEPWIYTTLRWVKYVAALGILIAFIKYHMPGVVRKREADKYKILTLLAAWSLIIFVALLRWMQITPASWGRLLYPALPAVVVLIVWGLSHFTLPTYNSYMSTGPPPLVYAPLPLLVVVILFVLALVSPFATMQPAYAKPRLIAEADLPSEGVERLDVTYDQAMRLLAYRVEATPARPGERLLITLYWQVTQPITKNYSVFIHLLNPQQEVVGQVNSYPAGGNWPTSMLMPGRVLKDTYYVPIAAETRATTILRLGLGIFEFDDPTRTAKKGTDSTGQPAPPLVGAIPLVPREGAALTPAHRVTANFAGQIRLAGYDLPQAETRRGDTIPITFYWEAVAPPGRDLTLFMHLLDPATKRQVTGFDAPPDYPTSFWQAGQSIMDERELPLSRTLPAGSYALQIGWYDPTTMARLPLTDGRTGDTLPLLTLTIQE
jgi:hypothetical protein